MDNKLFILDPYFERLNYSGGVQPTEDRLEALHRAQAYTIPFENFDAVTTAGKSFSRAGLLPGWRILTGGGIGRRTFSDFSLASRIFFSDLTKRGWRV